MPSYDLDVHLHLSGDPGTETVTWDLDVALVSTLPGSLVGSAAGFDLFVLDRSLRRIALIAEYNSLVWTSRIWDHSEATLKCPPDALPEGACFLERSDTNEAMLITRVHQVLTDKERYAEVGCKGATLMLSRRVNWWTHTFNETYIVDVANTLIEDAQATYQDIDRTIALMATEVVDLTDSVSATPGEQRALLYDLDVRLSGTAVITKQVSWGTCAEAVYEACRAVGAAFGVRYGDGILEPFIRTGADLSASIVFSSDFFDITSASVDRNRASAANLAVVGGSGEGNARNVTTQAVPDGEELAELWVDAASASSENMTNDQYLASLRQQGAEKIADLPVTLSLEADVAQSRFRYRSDYQLGDRVGYRALGFTGSDVLSEVTETIEGGEKKVGIALGTTAPTIRKLLR